MGLIWLAAYPKSGMTWLRFLLANYMNDNMQSSMEVFNDVPDIHALLIENRKLSGSGMEARSSSIMPCSTHFLYTENHPYYENTSGFIYLMRHPKDVLLSNLNYAKLSSSHGQINEKEFALDFIENRGMKHWVLKGFGTWENHARY